MAARKKTDAQAPAATTALAFDATITGVKPVIAKSSWERGAVDITLRVTQPEALKVPTLPEVLTGVEPVNRELRYSTNPNDIKPRPDALRRRPPREDEETDEAYDARCAQRLADLQAAYDDALAVYSRERETYEAALPEQSARVRNYALLVGISALLGSGQVSLTMAPKNYDMLPGFGALDLTPLPALAEAADDDEEYL